MVKAMNSVVSPDIDRMKGRAPGGMWWVAWRQHRLTVLVSTGLLLATTLGVAVFRWIYTATIPADLDSCRDPSCAAIFDQVAVFQQNWIYLRVLLETLPVLVGAVIGASVIAQERDRGTQVFALTQSVSRTRWYLTKCALVLTPATAAAVLAGLAARWAVDVAPSVESPVPMSTPGFQVTGLVPAAFLLLSFGLSAVVGSLLRSTLGAIVLGLAASTVAVVILGYWSYLSLVPENQASTPLTVDNVYGSVYLDSMTPGSLVRRMGYAGADGHELVADDCRVIATGDLARADSVKCLQGHGVTDRLIIYVDGSRYGQLVATLGAGCAAVAALGIGFGLRRLQRRVL